MTWKKIISMVLLLCTLMSMFAMPAVGAASVDTVQTGAQVDLASVGANVSDGTIIYFDASNVAESGTVIQFMIGHGSWSQGYPMTKVSNSNLYYVKMPLWEGASEYAIFGCNEEWGGEGSSVTSRKAWAPWSTSVMGATDLSGTVILTANSSGTLSKSSASLNTTQTATACYQSTGGGSYSTGTTGGTVKVSGYNVSGTTGTAKSSSTSGTGISSGIGTTVTMTATAATGYTFKGWFTSTTATSATSTSATYTYTNTGSAKTLYAKFQLNGPYTVTVQTNSTSYGTVSTASSSVYWGKTTTLTATPKTGYHLSSWAITSGSGSLSSTTALKPTLTVKGNVTAKATFAANTGKVTFSAGTGGSVSSTGGSTTYSGTKASTATASTGYYFTGWTISGGTLNTDYKITSGSTSSASITIQPITQNASITCKANFAAQYKITTQVNYPVLGSVTKSVTYVTPGGTATITASPTTGNTFSKWTFPSGSCTYTSGSATSTSITIKPTSNVTVQGNFNAGLNVTAGSNGSVSPSGKSYHGYDTAVTLTATPNTGYHFAGWTFGGTYGGSPSTSSASTTIRVRNNTTAKASFAINTYTVTFKDWDGTVLATKTVNHGSSATAPSNPTRTGYEFTGWSGTYTNVTANQTVTATYKDVQYYLMGDMNSWGGTVMSESGNIASVTVHLEPGTYKFKLTKDGTWWGNDGTIVDTTLNTSSVGWEMYTSAGDCTLQAFGGDYTFNFNKSTGFLEVIYNPDRFTVSFFNWDGTLLKSDVIMKGKNATPPANPTKAGDAQYSYTFSGWDKSYTNVQSTLDIHAQFTQTTNKYTVTFKNWDGTVLSTQSVAYGSSATAPSNPTRPATAQYSYTFSGWSGSYTNITGDVTVTAQYTSTVNKYTVKFVNWDGTVLSTQTVEYGKSATAPANPTRPATAQYTYTFSKWDTSYTNITGNTTVTAVYTSTVNKYTVTFKNYDGTVLGTSTVNYGSAATYTGSTPTKPATAQYSYTFSGWDKAITNITGNLTVTAQFTQTVNKYTVTFKNWDGTVLSTQSVAYGSGATKPSNPTRPATAQYTYTFTGWDKDFSNITGNLTVTAQYSSTVNKYTVTFKNWDGTVISTQSIAYGSSATAPANPTRPATAQYTYTFSKWDTSYTNITGNTTVTAVYTATVNKYTVTFKNWDGSTIATKSVEYGSAATAPTVPAREGFEFTGWDKDFSNITGNLTVTAQYIDSKVYLLGSFNNWATDTIMTTKSGDIVSTMLILDPGEYTFKILHKDVWYGNYGTIEDTTVTTSDVGWEMADGANDCTLVASGGSYTFNYNTATRMLEVVFESDRRTVTFVNWDGTVLKKESVKEGTSATAPADPTRPADAQYTYTFSGWDKTFTNVTTDLTVTAQYSTTVNKYTVTFVNWDGTVLSTQSIAYGSAASKPSNPTRPATAQYTYTFSGWDKDFSKITGNLTVTAQYTSTVNKYTVTFKNWDGTVLSTQSIAYGSSATAPATPTRPATAQYTYTFSKWDTSYTNITGNTTVTAVYTSTVNKYTVKFVDWDGSTLATRTVEYGNAATAPSNPTRTNYAFTGWDKDFSNITGDLTVTAQYVDTRVYIPGSFNGWATDTPLTTQSGDIVTTTFRIEAGTYQFKVLHKDVWYGNSGTIVDTTTATSSIGWEMSASNGDNCTLQASGGTYTFNYNTATHFLEILYTPDTYTVTFVNWDGTTLKTETVISGKSATAPSNPTREATAQYTYTFKGWDKEFTNVTSDLTVKAQYTETVNKYTVTFKGWDGSVLATRTVEYGKSATAPTAPSRAGYEFTGWDKDFSNVTGNITVTAQYIDARVYLVGDFNNWGVDTILTTASGNIVSTTLRIEEGSYEFKILYKDAWYGNSGTIEDTTTATSSVGWEMATGAGNCILNATGGTYTFNYNTETRMLEVLFSPDSYTVVFKNWDGTVLSTQSVVEGSAAKAPQTPTRPATAQYTYTFKAWDTDFSNVTADLVVTATYTQTTNKYTVTFVNWDGTVLNTQSVAYGSAATAPSTPTRAADAQYSYTFKAWDKSFTNITGDLTVTATYSSVLNKYTVTFKNWDGTTLDTQTVEYGKAASAPTAPVREGYEFSGWDVDFTNITGDLTVTAQFTDVQVYLLGDFNNWATDTVMTTTNGNIVSATLQLTAGEYKFKITSKGIWYGNNGTIEDTTITTSAIGWEMVDGYGDCVLKATGGAYTFNFNTETRMLEVLFESDSFTVTFKDWDGTILKTESVKAGASATAPADPTRAADAQYTYTFKAWDTSFTNIQAATTVTATYTQTLNKYTVTFKDHDGTVLSAQTVEYGKGAEAPADPTRAGYEFIGWDKDFSNITADITVTAQYSSNKIYLLGSFNNWEQNNEMTASTGNIVSVTLDLEPGTYIFKILAGDNWYGNWGTIEDTTTNTSDIGWEMTTDAGDCTLTASGGKYTFNFNTETRMLEVLSEVNYFTVTFVNWDGSILKSESVKKGDSATAPDDPTRAADSQYTYTFKAWDTSFTNIQAATTVTATYTKTLNKYTVTFVNWDGTEISSQEVEYGSAATAPKDPTREGTEEITYTFAGWDKDFSNITGDTVVTATYTASGSVYTVTFVNYDGTVLKTETVSYGLGATAPEDPTRDGDAQYSYTFAGWDKSFDAVTADITVTATYVTSTNTYTVTFVNYDGSVLKTQQVAYGSAATAPVNPTRPTTSQYIFTFDGWDKDYSYITGDLTVKATYTAKVNSSGTSSNIYNLSSEVQKGQILQCWNWSYNNIKYHMQDIASQGFSAIQTSPVQATKETTKEYYNTVWNSSWVVYQPVSFTMETNSFNALGTKADFEAMCAEAHKYGIKVIVDVVLNHMANDMSENTIHPWVPADLRENADCWHDISKNIYDFGNRYDVTHYCLTGLPDLNTANSTVQWHCTNLLKECIAAGADGFRIDAAKHIETDWDADGVKSDFWYNVLGAATAYAQSTRGFTPYYYGEFIGAPEGIGIDAYTRYMSVTDTGANSIREAVCNGDASAAASSGITYGEPASKAVLWTESHDNFKDNGTRFISDHNINKTWALVGSRAEACGLYLARPSNIDTTLMGAADVTSWSYPEVRAINQFKNHFVGQGEYLSSYNSLACVERGSTGMVIVNVGGTYYNGMSAPVHTMEEGVYSDAITGNTFTVSGGYITGDIGDTGIAVVYRVGDNGPFTAGNPTEVSLVGSFNNWDASSHVFVANDKQTATTTLFLEAGTYTFKITTSSGLWYGNSGTITDTTGSTPWSMYANVSDNCTLVASGGRYTFTFDSTTGKLSVEHQSTYDYNSTVYLKGTFNDWGTTNLMTYTGQNHIVTTTVTLDAGTYTFKLNNTGAGVWYGNTGTIYDTTATSAASGWVMSTSVNDNCTLEASGGIYTFNFNLSTNQLIVLYTPPTYKVTFVDWDGTVLSEQTVQKGQAASAPVSPTRESDGTYTYTFTGWDKEFTNITGDTVVTAQYTTAENVYTVTFVDYDGIVLYYQVVAKGEDATAPEDPVRMGNAQYSYEFAGWDGDYTNVQSDITITATYTETVNEYTVTFNDYDGTVITTQKVAYGSAADAPETPTREGNAQYSYTFNGWDVDFSEIKADLTVTATYTETVNKYTVIFLDHDGKEISKQSVEYGSAAEAPADPTRAGYVFTGWDKAFGEITEDTTVYAQYAEDIVYVYGSFNDWTDSTKMTATDTDGVVTATVKLEAGTYKFKIKHINNWYGNTGTIEDTTLKTSDVGWEMSVDTDDCTLQASGGFYTFTFNKNTRMLEITFISATHTVTFLDYEGNVIDEVTVDHEGEAQAPEAPAREGFLFAGWDKDITCVTEDMTVTATYVEATEEYAVTFVNYDGTVLYTQTVKAGESAEAPEAPTREKDDKFSYTFKGWDKDFSRVVGDMIVTATFTETPHKFTVIFLDHDGTELSKVEVEYGKSAEAPETPVREGYVFTGWDKDITEITEDITVTAQYKEASIFLMGSFNDWQEDLIMTEGEDAGVVSVTVTLDAGTYYFKIKNVDTWLGNTGTIEDTTLNTSDIGWEMVTDTDNCTLVASGGTYTFNYNTETNMLEVLFTPPSYTVKFVDHDGTVIEEVTVVRGEDAKAPADPERAGYKFISWEGDFTNVQSDLTITALYIQIKITYTVTFLDFDGTVLKSQIVTTGEAAEAPEDPTREYYTFLGWDKDFSNITYNLTVNALYQDTRSYLTGSFNDWSKDTVMTEDGNIVSVEMILKAGTYSFKLISKDTWFTNTGIIEDTTLTTSDIGWEMIADQSIGDCTLQASGGKYTFNFNMETKMLEVIYTPIEYTVQFVDYNGTVLKEQTVKLGENAEAPEVSDRNGFIFVGWDKKFENIESDLTVNAVYIPNDTTYTVTFVGMDGTILGTQKVGHGQDAVAPEAPEVDGYVFVGWDEEFSHITGEKTITAQYKEDIVYIFGSFNEWAEGIEMTAGEENVHEYTLTLGKGTYYFKLSHIDIWYGNAGAIDDTTLATSDIGWEMLQDADNLTLNATGGKYTFRYNTETKMLEVIYEALEYTVVFKDKDGEILSETTVKLGDTVEAPTAPEVEGFIFVGWDKDFENIAEDLEINAVYIEDNTKYTVAFVDMDGTVLYTQYVEYGKAAEKPADPTRVGYIFTGWDKDFSKITGDTVITAQYKDNQIYLVGTFNDWQTDISLRREGSTNIFSTMIDLEAGSYFFKLLQNDVWYTNASTIIDTTKVTSDSGIELRTDTSLGDIILNASGGTYEFKFNVATNELVVIFYAGAIQKYTVTFVNWDGTVIDTLVVASGKDATAPADPTREGDAQYTYTFAGWDRDFTNITEDLTVTALYNKTVNKYTVTFTDTDGNVIETQTVEYGAAATAPTAPVIEGYIFKGWDKDFSKVTGDITVKATYQKGVASNVTLAGTFNGWDSSASPFLITDNADKVTLQMKLEEGTYQFKVVENGSWYGNWGTIADTTITTSATGWVMDASAGDCTLIAGGGTYVFTYTISTHTLEVMYLGSEFKVTFVDWDGTVIKTEVVEPGGSATAPTGTFTRPADDGYTYVFTGWDQDFTNVIAPLRVNAVYTATPKMYTVTFVDWNGALLKSQRVAYGTAATPPADPVRSGYIFSGWDGDIWYITGNTTFRAQYTDNGVYIMGDFNDWQGTKLSHIGGNVYQGSIYLAAGQYKFKVKQGYDWFGNNGWIDDTTTYTSDVGWEMSWDAGDCTLNASGSTYTFRYNTATRMLEVLYVAPTYTVVFKDWNGATLKTQYVKRGNPAYAPANPTRTGYIFTGWDRDFGWIYENTTVTAQYALNTVSVMGDFNNWEGTGMAPAGGTMYTATVELQAGTYKFKIKHADTWYGNGGTIENSTLATSAVGWEMVWDQGDCTLNATGGTYTFNFNTETRMLEILYKGQVYTVTFLDYDGSIISTQQVEYGKSATAPAAPVREGFEFSGWSGDFSFITGNTTIMAQYGGETVVYLRGTFNNWDMSSPMISTVTPKVYTYVLTLAAGEYTFKINIGDVWYGNNGTIEDTTLATSETGWDMDATAGDCKLVAQGGTYLFRYNTETNKLEILRVVDELTVTFKDYDGKVLSEVKVKYGEAAQAPEVPARDGYTFAGWDQVFDNVTENITVTAMYKKTVVLNGYTPEATTDEMKLTEDSSAYEVEIELEKGEYYFEINYGGVIYSLDTTFAESTEGITLVTGAGKVRLITFGGIYKFIFDTESKLLRIEKLRDASGDEVIPDTPSTGDEPEVPDTPSTGDEPEAPDTPSTGDEPEIPDDPEVPEEPVIKEFLVVYVNTDGKFLGFENVIEGQAAVNAPEASYSDEHYTYTFIGWDKSLSSITSDMVVTALYLKVANTYTVTFKDYNGRVLKKQTVAYSSAATAPNDPTREGYVFRGWDKDFTNVQGDMIVTARYSKIVEAATEGTLRIEVAGGTSFTLSVDGGKARPQGTSYLNTKMPIAASVTVVANTTGTNAFLGWMNERGLILSTDATYTFVTTGNDYLRAMYETDVENAVFVVFKNDKANQVLDMQYYVAGDEIVFPELPRNASYTATGWSMTAEEIAAAVAEGRSVTVTPTWERILVYVNVTVNGGTATGLTNGKVLRLNAVTVKADAAPAGKKFAYWIDQNGEIQSYKSEYKFYPAADTELTAVYVKETASIDYSVILSVNMDTSNASADVNTVILSWEVPSGSGITFVQAGALLVDESKYDANTFYKGTTDSNVTKWTPGSANQLSTNTVTVNKKGVAAGSTWIVQGWITYIVNGETVTVYTEPVKVTK